MKFPSAVIEMWDIKRVIPNQNNPRKHPKKQIKKLVRSLRKFGLCCKNSVNESDSLRYIP
jgi:hypothetical protein